MDKENEPAITDSFNLCTENGLDNARPVSITEKSGRGITAVTDKEIVEEMKQEYR